MDLVNNPQVFLVINDLITFIIFEKKCPNQVDKKDQPKILMSIVAHTQNSISNSTSSALIKYDFSYIFFLDAIFAQ